jgi:thiamine pyrophosphokinase
MESKRCAIFLNGIIKDYNYIKTKLRKNDFIIAVDGGIDHIKKLSLFPNLILGDFDSSVLSEALKYKNAEIKKYKKDKDYTDGEIAINYVIDEKYFEVVIFGALGNRIDHMLSNINMLERLSDNKINGVIIEKDNEINFLDNKIVLMKEEFRFFSIIPITDKILELSIKNAKYELNNEMIIRTESKGISNEFLDEPVLISIDKGKALVIRSN